MGRILVFIAGLAAGAAGSALGGQKGASFGVSVEVAPLGISAITQTDDGPQLQVGGQRVLLEGNGSAVATVEY